MGQTHVVKQGECIQSIAARRGLPWEKIWDHPDNAALKELRKKPNVLKEGDGVFIPEKETKEIKVAVGERHRFRLKAQPLLLRLKFQKELGGARANEDCTIEVDGQTQQGCTDADGVLEIPLGQDTTFAKVVFGSGETKQEYECEIGALDPIDTTTGLQARLANLGYEVGAVDGDHGECTSEALKEFQDANDLEPTGELDDETRALLEQECGL